MKILRNSARCKTCGHVLTSTHRWHFDRCPCGNFVDGGLASLRRGGDLDALEELSVYGWEYGWDDNAGGKDE